MNPFIHNEVLIVYWTGRLVLFIKLVHDSVWIYALGYAGVGCHCYKLALRMPNYFQEVEYKFMFYIIPLYQFYLNCRFALGEDKKGRGT